MHFRSIYYFDRLIIADELDYLITKDRVVLHDLFMLTTLPFSRCILIGIQFNSTIFLAPGGALDRLKLSFKFRMGVLIFLFLLQG